MPSRVCVIGLDCAPPELVFGRFRDDMPNLRELASRGTYGPLESTIPPITVPAWMSMMTGRDPGALGIYGFRNRRDYSYDGLAIANSRMVKVPTVWDVIAQHGKQSTLIGVPLTYPPRPINGHMVCDFMAPDAASAYTYPADLRDEITRAVGDYIADVKDFRTDDKGRLLGDIRRMTEQRFALSKYMLTAHAWDLFVMVEMGPDRMHHGLWRHCDPTHPLYDHHNPYRDAMRDYYARLDELIGEMIALLPADTLVLVVSDHGAKTMDGGICLNEWLIQEGYLTLHAAVTGPTRLTPEMVDWNRTRVWGDGGYYGRVFINAEGREPQGIVPRSAVEGLRSELIRRLEALPDEHGRPIGTRAYRPEDVYTQVNGVAPDLIVHFGALDWRSVGSVGHGALWVHANDTGPDDANHSMTGIAVVAPASGTARETGPRSGMSIYDIAPTILGAFGVKPPTGMGRQAIGVGDDEVYSAEEEAEIARRLEDLGYI